MRLASFFVESAGASGNVRNMPKDTLSVTDNRTGKAYEIKIQDGCVKTSDLRQIKVDDKRLWV